MKYLFEFNSFDIISHLKERGIDPKLTRVLIDEKTSDSYFFLYNLTGQMVGYQKYNPLMAKTGQGRLEDPRLARYFIWAGDEGYGKKIAVWGLETLNWTDEFLFITEGIFDCVKIHQAGEPAIAVMCNDPSDSLKSWIKTLPQKRIVIYDNDIPGKKLKKIGDYNFTVPDPYKDLGEMSQEEATRFIKEIKSQVIMKNPPNF